MINRILLALFVGCLLLAVGLRRDLTQPQSDILPDMVEAVAYESLAANPSFADGKTLQAPVAGTIARGEMPLHFAATPQDALRAGLTLGNPYRAADAEALQRGEFVYRHFCQVCHGNEGKGDGPVLKRGVPLPPSLLADKARTMKDGQLFHILTYGQGNMASHAGQLSRADRWRAVLFVRSLQQQASRPTTGRKKP